MLSDQELNEVIEDLQSQDLPLRTATLKDLQEFPSTDVRVLSYLETLLDDYTPCILALPYYFGEIRWLAAYALAAERFAMNIKEPVRLKDVVKPLNTEELITIQEKFNLPSRGGIEGMLEMVQTLREQNCLPLYDLELLSATVTNYKPNNRDLKVTEASEIQFLIDAELAKKGERLTDPLKRKKTAKSPGAKDTKKIIIIEDQDIDIDAEDSKNSSQNKRTPPKFGGKRIMFKKGRIEF